MTLVAKSRSRICCASACGFAMAIAAGCTSVVAGPAAENHRLGDATAVPVDQGKDAPYPSAFSGLTLWDDGLSEICYYDATDVIYGRPRHYTRVMHLNREWLDPAQRVKAEAPDPAKRGDVPVLKLTIAEEIPTENYNYRYMVTVFLNRTTLQPEKLAASSQEWCGTTFKELLWLPGVPVCEMSEDPQLRIRSFSYFQGEGDREWSLPLDPIVVPQEALFVLARAAAAAGKDMAVALLPAMRSVHMAEPKPISAQLRVGRTEKQVSVPLGRFRARVVRVTSGADVSEYAVELAAPFRLLTYRSAHGQRLALRHAEHRAYWDRAQPSGFYRPGSAP